MAYLTAAELKAYKDIDTAADDMLLTSLIAAAQKYIENRTRRVFEASADATRYYTVGADTNGAILWLDRDLASITSITNNANGTVEVLATTDYVTLPRTAPFNRIKLLGASGKSWRYTVDPENSIAVVGKWAYATSPPEDIKHACRRLATYYYMQKDAQVFDITAMPDQGAIVIPKGVPADVDKILDNYTWMVVA